MIAYVVCQALGWSVWGGLNFTFFAVSDMGVTFGTVVWTIAASALGLALSHAYRAVIRRRRWTARPLHALVPRVIGASIVQAVVLDGAMTALARVLTPASAGGVPIGASVIFAFNFTILYVSWSTIYFAVHWFERSRRAERAELHFLKAQLNPHFLYNALNSVRGLIGEDPARAQEAVTRLAKLLRAALGSVAADTVPLADELAVVDDYLALEAVRLEHRLAVSLDIAPDTLTARVPSMLVQTLVENAIKHGVARRRDGGQLRVHAELRGRVLAIDVENTPGPEPAPEPVTARGGGVGLANASERLQLLFGVRATLRLDRSRRDLTVARARIPLP
ncbi:MAG TPA: histidine kinase [Kofleriaceae bacterium]|nr:histidine kinase [Kofleriaceae bacterium]